jgi:DNA-binding response OmpR family regulator
MYRILIVEDDAVISKTLQNHLTLWGFEAFCAVDFKDVLSRFVSVSPHLVLLDISLPFYNGYYWCGELRRISKVPIIFISSASDNMNIVLAMNMGADDFIVKPFDLNILVAKVGAILRRAYDFAGQSGLLEHKKAILNTGDATLTYGGEKIELTKNEYKILLLLMENKGKVVSRDAIMAALWATDCFVDENTLAVNIARLRKKLENAGLSDFITTKKGLGYLVE